jgi:hypothetical protein
MARPFLVPFRRLLRLAGSQWRYSTPPPHGLPLLVGTEAPFYFAYPGSYQKEENNRWNISNSTVCVTIVASLINNCHISLETLHLQGTCRPHYPEEQICYFKQFCVGKQLDTKRVDPKTISKSVSQSPVSHESLEQVKWRRRATNYRPH